jgi:hypothetical protein
VEGAVEAHRDDVIPLVFWKVLHRAHKLNACSTVANIKRAVRTGRVSLLALWEVLHRAHKLDACSNVAIAKS